MTQVAVLSTDDVAALVRQTIAETLAAQPAAPPPPSEPSRLALSTREAAEALGISERTLWSLTSPRGDLRSIKAGSRTLYPVAALEQWLADRAGEAAWD